MTATTKLAIATIFGVLIFVTKAVLPTPMNKMVILVHALLLTFGNFFLGKKGATYVSIIGGTLTALWNITLGPFSFLFSFLYGLLVDGFIFIFKAKTDNGVTKTGRLTVAMTLSTGIVGVLSYLVMALLMGLIPRNFPLEVGILIIGFLSGATAGYLASKIWNTRLKNIKF